MVHLDAMTIALLCGIFFYAITSLCVLGIVLRPVLVAAVNGIIQLANLAADHTGKHNRNAPRTWSGIDLT